jgi:hypothetical protein
VQVLSQRQHHGSAGTEISVTGRDARLPPWRLGLGRSRGDRLRRSLEKSAEAGNRVQSSYRLTVLKRTSHGGGLNLRLERMQPTGARRPRREPLST